MHYHNTDLISDLQKDLLELRDEKNFMDTQSIYVQTDDFFTFLNLFKMPRYLRSLVDDKYLSLDDQRNKLRAMLQEDADEI